MLMQLKIMSKNSEYGGEITQMIKEQTKVWHDALSDEQKQKLKDVNLNKIVDELFNISDEEKKANEKNSKKTNKKQSKKSKKSKTKKVKKAAEPLPGKLSTFFSFIKTKYNFKDFLVQNNMGLNLSDEQMKEIYKIIEQEEKVDEIIAETDAVPKQEL